MSVLQKASAQAATKQDVHANIAPLTYLPTEVISDGQLIYENIVELELTEEWLMKKLKKTKKFRMLRMCILPKFKQMAHCILA
ncbi:DUF421 domain-containing protein [Lysinibacillus sp. MHQ-1]|nr:DUF421 domain-containing protein [Lysinibacillus sp. MHQ-1]